MGDRGVTFGDVDRMSSEAGSVPHQAAFLGEKGRHLAADELVADGLVAVGVNLVGVCHFPRAARAAVVVAHGLFRRRVFGLVRVEGVAVFVFRAADFAGAGLGVDLEDGVQGPVDVGVDSHAE